MSSPDIVTVCSTAFFATFVLLTVLAAMMRLLIALFPEREEQMDTATVAAIAAAVRSQYPTKKIVRIERQE